MSKLYVPHYAIVSVPSGEINLCEGVPYVHEGFAISAIELARRIYFHAVDESLKDAPDSVKREFKDLFDCYSFIEEVEASDYEPVNGRDNDE